jgi:gallate decarboxylase subunit D
MNIIKESFGIGKYIIEAVAVCSGKDINITIGGGELYHIGAVAVAVPRNEVKNGKKRSATASVICVQGHKEDEFAHYASKYLATALDSVVTVSVGVHVDNANEEDIKVLYDNFKNLVKKLEKAILENQRK